MIFKWFRITKFVIQIAHWGVLIKSMLKKISKKSMNLSFTLDSRLVLNAFSTRITCVDSDIKLTQFWRFFCNPKDFIFVLIYWYFYNYCYCCKFLFNEHKIDNCWSGKFFGKWINRVQWIWMQFFADISSHFHFFN